MACGPSLTFESQLCPKPFAPARARVGRYFARAPGLRARARAAACLERWRSAVAAGQAARAAAKAKAEAEALAADLGAHVYALCLATLKVMRLSFSQLLAKANFFKC